MTKRKCSICHTLHSDKGRAFDGRRVLGSLPDSDKYLLTALTSLNVDEAVSKATKENKALFKAVQQANHSKLEKLLKQGEKPSKQMIELLFYWLRLRQDLLAYIQNKKTLRLLVKYEAYKPTLWELIKYRT